MLSYSIGGLVEVKTPHYSNITGIVLKNYPNKELYNNSNNELPQNCMFIKVIESEYQHKRYDNWSRVGIIDNTGYYVSLNDRITRYEPPTYTETYMMKTSQAVKLISSTKNYGNINFCTETTTSDKLSTVYYFNSNQYSYAVVSITDDIISGEECLGISDIHYYNKNLSSVDDRKLVEQAYCNARTIRLLNRGNNLGIKDLKVYEREY